MYVLPLVSELSLFGVYDANVPNKERVVLRPTQEVSLARFCLLVAVQSAQGGVLPIPDQFLWLGDLIVKPPAWLVVFTGPGTYNVQQQGPDTIYTFFWGRPSTIFTNPGIMPVVARLDALSVSGHNMKPGPVESPPVPAPAK
jgi:hypothetical protein